MAKWSFSDWNWTPTATADASNLANSTFAALGGGSTTQTTDILEVKIDGGASASAWTPLSLARCAVIATGMTALAGPNAAGPLHPATAALAAPVTAFISCQPGFQRSSTATDAKLDLGLNAFGGIVRWNAAPTQQWTMLGSTTQFGFSILSSQNLGAPGAISSHILYEPY